MKQSEPLRRRPEHLGFELEGWTELDTSKSCLLPYCENCVQAGMPVSCLQDEHQVASLTAMLHLDGEHFMTTVRGESMTGAGIFPGDLLIVRRTREAEEGQIVIAEVDGGCTVKVYHYDAQQQIITLQPCNPQYPPICIPASRPPYIYGVVEHSFKSLTNIRL